MTVVEYANRGIDWKRSHGCEERVKVDGVGVVYACGGEYTCPGCERVLGYCNGACDELGELCDDCAMVVLRYRKMFNRDRTLEAERLGIFLLQ